MARTFSPRPFGPWAALRPAPTSWPGPPSTPFRRRVWEMLIEGQKLIQELTDLHQQVHAEVNRGTPFPPAAPEEMMSASFQL